MEFVGFGKIPRLFRDVVITEKIDGTNGQIYIHTATSDIEQGSFPCICVRMPDLQQETGYLAYYITAASRSRWISPESDNHGFAKWVYANAKELTKLGPGHHFGEWWGQGINRGYGLKEKRFSLFNVAKWGDDNVRPLCCHVVPVLWAGNFDMAFIRATLADLQRTGSVAAPGFMKPEGVVVYHTAGNNLFKVTVERDDVWKGEENV